MKELVSSRGLAGIRFRPVSGMEVSAMAGALSPQQRSANFERGFEFSRLHEEWMAAAYALVVPAQRGSHRQLASGGACKPAKPLPQARPQDTERKAG